jgi:hypothetical protein
MERVTRMGDGRPRRVQTCRAAMSAGPSGLPRQNRVERREAVLRLVHALPAPELVDELPRHGDRVGRVERAHRDRHAEVEYLLCGAGVAEHVELSDQVGAEGRQHRTDCGPAEASGSSAFVQSIQMMLTARDVDALHILLEEREVGVRVEDRSSMADPAESVSAITCCAVGCGTWKCFSRGLNKRLV